MKRRRNAIARFLCVVLLLSIGSFGSETPNPASDTDDNCTGGIVAAGKISTTAFSGLPALPTVFTSLAKIQDFLRTLGPLHESIAEMEDVSQKFRAQEKPAAELVERALMRATKDAVAAKALLDQPTHTPDERNLLEGYRILLNRAAGLLNALVEEAAREREAEKQKEKEKPADRPEPKAQPERKPQPESGKRPQPPKSGGEKAPGSAGDKPDPNGKPGADGEKGDEGKGVGEGDAEGEGDGNGDGPGQANSPGKGKGSGQGQGQGAGQPNPGSPSGKSGGKGSGTGAEPGDATGEAGDAEPGEIGDGAPAGQPPGSSLGAKSASPKPGAGEPKPAGPKGTKSDPKSPAPGKTPDTKKADAPVAVDLKKLFATDAAGGDELDDEQEDIVRPAAQPADKSDAEGEAVGLVAAGGDESEENAEGDAGEALPLNLSEAPVGRAKGGKNAGDATNPDPDVAGSLARLIRQFKTAAAKALPGGKKDDDASPGELTDETSSAPPVFTTFEPREDKNVGELSPDRATALMKTMMESLWVNLLRQYPRFEDLVDALFRYIKLCEELLKVHTHHLFLAQFRERAKTLHLRLQRSQIPYADLRALGVDTAAGVHDKDNTDTKRRLRFVDRILRSLSEVTSLTPEEAMLQQAVQRALAEGSVATTATDRQVGRAFLDQGNGPLWARSIRASHPGQPPDTYAYPRLASDLKMGKLDDYLMMANVAPYLNLVRPKTIKPQTEWVEEGPLTLFGNEFGLVQADDIDRIDHWQRNPLPPDHVLLDFATGKMLEKRYPDEIPIQSPRLPKTKRATIIIWDVSGSMSDNGKYLARNALIAGFTDRSQIEVAMDLAEQVIYSIPFDGTAHRAERIPDFDSAYAYFNQNRHYGAGTGGGTDITGAVVSGFNHAARITDLQFCDVLLISDGIDPQFSAERIRAARFALPVEVQVTFNAIMLGDENPQVKKLVGDTFARGLSSYYHISTAELADMLNRNFNLAVLGELALDYESAGEKPFSAGSILKVQERLNRLQSAWDRQDLAYFAWSETRTKKRPKAYEVATIDRFVDEFFRLAEAIPNWRRAQKTKFVLDFLQTLATEFEVDRRQIEFRMSDTAKARIKAWLEQ